MSVETATLEDLGQELGEKIADSPEHKAFREAQRGPVENDDPENPGSDQGV